MRERGVMLKYNDSLDCGTEEQYIFAPNGMAVVALSFMEASYFL